MIATAFLIATLAAASGADRVEDAFERVLDARGAGYERHREAFLALGDDARRLVAARAESDDWREATQARVLRGWFREPEAMRTIHRTVRSWRNARERRTVEGKPRLEGASFGGDAHLSSLVATELLWKHADTETDPQLASYPQQCNLVRELAALRNDVATSLLVWIASEWPAPPLRADAITALGELEDRRAIGGLVAIARSDAIRTLRRHAVIAIARIECLEALDALERLAAAELDPRIRREAEDGVAWVKVIIPW